MNSVGPAVVGHFGNQRRLVRHQFLDCRDVGNALATIRDADVWWAVKCCLMFMAFTCVRSNEARMATWDEINFETATWTIPATRMKTGTEHRVPLSAQAMEVLVYARGQSDDPHGSIFPPQRGGQYMNSRMLSSLLRRLEISCVPHGFRSSFGTGWADSHTSQCWKPRWFWPSLRRPSVWHRSWRATCSSNAGRSCRSGQIFSQRPWGQSSENCETRFAF